MLPSLPAITTATSIRSRYPSRISRNTGRQRELVLKGDQGNGQEILGKIEREGNCTPPRAGEGAGSRFDAEIF